MSIPASENWEREKRIWEFGNRKTFGGGALQALGVHLCKSIPEQNITMAHLRLEKKEILFTGKYSPGVVWKLLDSGADPNARLEARQSCGATPLHLAVRTANYRAAKVSRCISHL